MPFCGVPDECLLFFSLSLSLSLLLAFQLDYLFINREEAVLVLDSRAGPGKRLVGIEWGVGGRFELESMSGVDSGKVGVSGREKREERWRYEWPAVC